MAQHVVFTVRKDVGCNPGFFYTWPNDRGGAFWTSTRVGDTIRVWIVDVQGTRLFIEGDTHRRAGSQLEKEIRQIVGSIRFGEASIGIPPKGSDAEHSGERRARRQLLRGRRGHPAHRIYVYADGRLIYDLRRPVDLPEGANVSTTGFLERRLTLEGVELMRSEIASSGLFGDELDLAPHGPLDATPGSALERLVRRLTDPASWLPAAAWEDREVRTYVPSRYEVCFEGPTRESQRVLGSSSPFRLLRSRRGRLLRRDDR